MKKPRKHYTPDEKVAILRRHLLEKEPISKLCDEFGLQPTVFYRWQKEFFENGASAFEQKGRPNLHKSLKGECIRPGTPLSLGVLVNAQQRDGYVTPKDMLAGRQLEIHAERDRKLEEARKQRRLRRQQAA